MLKTVDVALVQEALIAGNYKQLLSILRSMGLPILHAWLNSPSNNIEKYKFTSNREFKQFLIEKFENSELIQPLADGDIENGLKQVETVLSLLANFYITWKYDAELLSESEESSDLSETEKNEKKRLHQQIKPKTLVDKNDRYPIHVALQALIFILCQQSNNTIKFLEQEILPIHAKDYGLNDEDTEFQHLQTKQDLLIFIAEHIRSLNNFRSYYYLSETISDGFTLNETQQEIEKIGEAISAFQTPNKKKKLLKYFGILLAFIASLACGLSTGGAIFLLFPSLPILGIGLGALIGFWGISANFYFFSQNFPDFLLSLLKKGGMSEYIDQEGKRRQLSAVKKYLFIPLAILASLTVGAGTVAITYVTVLALATQVLPILATLWPPLPLIIVGILSMAVGITLTVAVLTSTIEAIKDSQNFTWANVKTTLNNLSARQIWVYALKGLLVLIGLFGLAYFRYTAGLDLSNLMGPLTGPLAAVIMAGITGVIAYIPQAFFTVFSIQKLVKVYSPSIATQEATPAYPRSLFSRIKSGVTSVYTSISLIGNALGNAALVIVDSVSALSIVGAIGCFFNSWSGNLLEPDNNRQHRTQATAALAVEIAKFNAGNRGDDSAFTETTARVDASNRALRPRFNSQISRIDASIPEPESRTLSRTRSEYAHGSARLYKLEKNESEADTGQSNKREYLVAAHHG